MALRNLMVLDEQQQDVDHLVHILTAHEYRVSRVVHESQLLKKIDLIRPDLIFIPASQKFMNATKLCKQIKSSPTTKNTFVIFLVKSKNDDLQIEGLEAGADDIIFYSLTERVLIGKIKALLKRKIIDKEKLTEQSLLVDLERFLVIRKGVKVQLPKKEFEIISLLYSKPDKIFSRDEIKMNLWVNYESVRGRTIDVYIRKIREKLGDNIISTVNGIGYKLMMDLD